jgi:hypothetical protein
MFLAHRSSPVAIREVSDITFQCQDFQILAHAEAQLRFNIFSKARDPDQAGATVKREGFGLARSGLEHQAPHPERAGVLFECGEHHARETAAARGGNDIHPFDLSDPSLDAANRAAGNGVAIQIADEKRALLGGDFFGAKPKVRGAGLGLGCRKLSIQCCDEALHGRGMQLLAANEQRF